MRAAKRRSDGATKGGACWLRTHLVGFPVLLWMTLGLACTPVAPDGNAGVKICDQPGTICTVAGTGESLFNGDGLDALATALYYPLDIEFDDQGRPLILDFNNLRLRRLNADNTFETIMGLDYEDAPVEGVLAFETPLHHASDMEFDHLGRMVLAGNHVALVYRVDENNRVHWVAGNGDYGNTGDEGPASAATFFAPFGVAPTPDGGLYISDNEAHTVRYVDPLGVIHATAGTGTRGYSGDGGPGPQAEIASPTHLRLDPQGRVLICDTGNHAIRRVELDGTISTIVGTGVAGYTGDGGPAALAQLDSPTDLRFAPDGTLHIADRGNDVIRRIKADGTIETVIGTGGRGFGGDEGQASTCMLNRASAINFAPDGSLWIADTYNQRVRRVAGYAPPAGP